MNECARCKELFLEKTIWTSDSYPLCRDCADAIALVAFDDIYNRDTYDFSKYPLDFYEKVLSETEILPYGTLVNFRTSRIAHDYGLFKRKYHIFSFSDITKIEYQSTRKGPPPDENNNGAAIGSLIGGLADGLGGSIKGAVVGSRIDLYKKIRAGCDFIYVYYNYAGKEYKIQTENSMNNDNYLKYCICFEKIRELNGTNNDG